MAAKPVKVTFLGDLSDLSKNLSDGAADLDNFAGDARDAGNKAEAALSGVGDKADEIGSATSQAAGGLGDLGGALSLLPGPLGAVGGGMEALAPAVMGVTGAADLLNLATTKFPILAKAQTVATNALAGAQKALNLVMAGNPIALVVLAVLALIAVFVVLYQKNEAFRELVNRVFGALKDRVGEAVGKLGDFLSTVRDKLSQAGDRFGDMKDKAVNAIGTYSAKGGGALGKVYDIVDAVGSLPGTVRSAASDMWDSVKTRAENVIGDYKDKGGGALGKLYEVVDAVTGIGGTVRTKAANMWDGISDSFKGTINNMIRWWNDLSFSVDIPDKIPGLPDSFTISTPNIPFLANGGIVTKPTLAVIGEAGPEAVIPLNGRGIGGRFELKLTLSGQQLDALSRGRQVHADLSAFQDNGGRPVA